MNQRKLSKRFVLLIFFGVGFCAVPVFAADYELRAGYGVANAAQGGVTTGGNTVQDSARGFVLTALLQSPESWVDVGLQFEQLSSTTSGNFDLTFRRLGIVFQKEIRVYGFFVAPEIVFNFLNIAHYSSAGTEQMRANTTLAANLGGTLGYRFHGFGVSFNAGYRKAQLGHVFNTGAASFVGPESVGGAPDFSGLYLNLGVTVLL